VDEAKPFKIPKREVWEAYKRVKANQGAAGVDGQSITEFEADLEGNLYKLWNRLSSGSYFPPPVRRVDIPKRDGGGVRQSPRKLPDATWSRSWSRCFIPTPTVTDPANLRSTPCAQRESAAGATTGCSISTSRPTFDSIDWELMLKAVRQHTDCRWVPLYVERWLKAPVQMEDGSIVPRTAGTPQGGVISPLLANLFMHYSFDVWMARTHPHIPFERYADDGAPRRREEEVTM
jgi:RNA-directed DNA polymerase